ncbi:hypothetical protein M422DRAFT_258199 [Sphaerobolus stellatus SS14]|uniref:Uncharacterized protein n=1 Tax=Sphaerobolus stellatus (strain SS14) TaxID=990650 RepID=A0A0C9UVZ6_SPHS4|nr:hypothetical protein M422DRAFT_258199 [Sphaerobolus stellatus SS14]
MGRTSQGNLFINTLTNRGTKFKPDTPVQVLKHHDKVSTPFRAKIQAEKTSEDVEYTVVKTIPEAKQVAVGTLHAVKHSDISEDKN